MEACYAEGSKNRCDSIPHIPVGKLAHQNCIRRARIVAPTSGGSDQPGRRTRRGEERVYRGAGRGRRKEDRGDQGGERAYRARSQGGQGPGRGRAQAGQEGREQGRGRQDHGHVGEGGCEGCARSFRLNQLVYSSGKPAARMLQPLPRRLCKIVALHRRPRSGPDDAARIRSSIVYVSLWAYGHAGPWAMRRGFDSLVQTASGFNDAEAQAAGGAEPKPPPSHAPESRHRLPDGVCRHDGSRAPRPPGGSWHVRASLAQTGHWLRGLGRIDGMSAPDPRFDEVRDRLEESESGFGRLTAVRHAAVMTAPPAWRRPSVPLGTHPADRPNDPHAALAP